MTLLAVFLEFVGMIRTYEFPEASSALSCRIGDGGLHKIPVRLTVVGL